ncbi:hypothetical protein L1887_20002 [Cichorium endivia]|nr:hypothetical protein L1887_20002 [Cichorium endivia]
MYGDISCFSYVIFLYFCLILVIHYDATRAYAISKLANVLHTKELARILQAIQKDEKIRTDQKENKARVGASSWIFNVDSDFCKFQKLVTYDFHNT